MHLVEITNPREIRAIAEALRGGLPAAGSSHLFARSIDAFASPDYVGLFAVEDELANPDGCALGLATLYELPMEGRRALGIEGLCFREADLDDQLPIWLALVELAARKRADFLFVGPSSLNTPDVLTDLVRRGYLDGYRIDVVGGVGLQKPDATALYSAFTSDALGRSAFLADLVVRISTLRVPLEGVRYAGDGPLYRGDGRLACNEWSVASLPDLETHCRRTGFSARMPDADGHATPFAGTLSEQILHQGGVPVGTSSFSTSFDVAAYYATHDGRQDGIVFAVDVAEVREQAPLYDAYSSLVESCDWFGRSEFEALVDVVRLLGTQDGGRFLERCHAGSRSRFLDSCDIDWGSYVAGGLPRLVAAGIVEERLVALHEALESYWARALEIAVDTIHAAPDGGEPLVEEQAAQLLTYDDAFRRAESQLRAVHQPDAGWDLTPFGYIAKTCRDREVFSTGCVAGDAITEAIPVRAVAHASG